MRKKRTTINISFEAKSELDSVKSLGQSYDGIIREVAKFWREENKYQPVKSSNKLPEFREYALQKYPKELGEDLITMIEDLIERQRAKNQN